MKFKKISAALAAGLLCVTLLSACGSSGEADKSSEPNSNSTGQTDSASGEDSSSTSSENETVLAGSDELDPDYTNWTFRPADFAFPRMDQYDFPFMGMNAVLPESLLEKMDSQEVIMLSDEAATDDYSALKFAFLTWSTMTEEQKNTEVENSGDGYSKWLDSLGRIGALGVYQAGMEDDLDTLPKCPQHEKLGQSEDGSYVYYLSTNPDAGNELTSELEQISVTLSDMAPFQQISAFEQPIADKGSITSVGTFTTQDINGKTYTQDMFRDYDLTMINLFTTWCSPCINEIPDLEKLSQEMAEKGVNVVGIVLDAADESGNPDQEIIEKAKVLTERTGAAYPFLIPDSTAMNGRLQGIDSVPETFFVDRDGNIVGETYVGSRSLEEWREVVTQELENLKGTES